MSKPREQFTAGCLFLIIGLGMVAVGAWLGWNSYRSIQGKAEATATVINVEVIEGGPDDSTGEIEFIARFSEKGEPRVHHEVGQFKKDKGIWYFTDGKAAGQRPVVRTAPKIGRNDPCHCGSGQKYKKCCIDKQI